MQRKCQRYQRGRAPNDTGNRQDNPYSSLFGEATDQKLDFIDHKPGIQEWWYPYPDSWFREAGGRKHV